MKLYKNKNLRTNNSYYPNLYNFVIIVMCEMSKVSELKRFFEEGAFKEKLPCLVKDPINYNRADQEEGTSESPKISIQSSDEETPTTTSTKNEVYTVLHQLDNIIDLEIKKLSNHRIDEDYHYETIVENEDQKEVVEELEKIKKEEKSMPQPIPGTFKSSTEQINEAVNIIANKEDELEVTKLVENIKNSSRKSNENHATNQASLFEELVEIRDNVYSMLGDDWHTRTTRRLTDKKGETVKNSQEICSLIESLKYSELKYFDDLKGVVSVYLFTIKRHSSELIKARSDVLTQRVEALFECQKKFGCDLVSVHSIEDLSACFTKHTQLIHLYEEFLVDELGHITTVIAEVGTNFKKEVNLKDMLTSRLSDYNIALKEIATLSDNVDLEEPINRVTHVVSVFSNIQKPVDDLLKPINKFDELKFNKKVPSLVFIDCHMDDSFGNYLLKNTFVVLSEQDNNATFSVHLYSKVMLFTKENEDSYYYQKHISMYEIGQPCIESPNKKKHAFSFVHYTKSGKISYKFKKISKEIAQLWLETIEDLLKKQQEKLIKEKQVAQLNQ